MTLNQKIFWEQRNSPSREFSIALARLSPVRPMTSLGCISLVILWSLSVRTRVSLGAEASASWVVCPMEDPKETETKPRKQDVCVKVNNIAIFPNPYEQDLPEGMVVADSPWPTCSSLPTWLFAITGSCTAAIRDSTTLSLSALDKVGIAPIRQHKTQDHESSDIAKII